MDFIPDVVGLKLENALNILNKIQLEIAIQETHAPRKKANSGECRVIQQNNEKKNIKLIVSYF